MFYQYPTSIGLISYKCANSPREWQENNSLIPNLARTEQAARKHVSQRQSEVQMAVPSAMIVWNGAEQVVRVLATGQRPLLGRARLAGQKLVMPGVNGGTVTIDAL